MEVQVAEAMHEEAIQERGMWAGGEEEASEESEEPEEVYERRQRAVHACRDALVAQALLPFQAGAWPPTHSCAHRPFTCGPPTAAVGICPSCMHGYMFWVNCRP